MGKIFRVYAYRGSNMGVEYLDLPATPYALLDVVDRVRPEEGETARFFVEEVRGFDFLSRHLVGGYGLPELNALAEKLAELDEGQATVLAGLVQMDEAGRLTP